MKRRSIFLNGLIIAAGGALTLFLYRHIVPHKQTALTDQIMDSLGLTIVLLGQYLRISARGYKSEKLINHDTLITDGPYSLVRHPMYLASFLIGLGMAMLLFAWWGIVIYAFFFLLWYWPQVHNEQQWLIKKFGQQYIDYCKTTPCCLPRLSALVCFRAKKYMPLKPAWIKKEWNTILIWFIVAVAAEGYQDITSFTLGGFLEEFVLLMLIVLYFVGFAILFRAD
jgi:protein-S-isoprenylcysteine O-methyltransferase Ste14